MFDSVFQSNIAAIQLYIKAIGRKLLSQSLLVDDAIINIAITHELDEMKTWETGQSQISPLEMQNKFPFVACSKYFDAHKLKETLSGYMIEYHVTYSSASDSSFCVIFYPTAQQHRVMTASPPREVILMDPVPSVLKFERGIHALLQHWTTLFRRPEDEPAPSNTHLLRSLLFSGRAGLSIVFRNGTSLAEQQRSVDGWGQSQSQGRGRDRDRGRDRSAQKMLWGSDALQSHFLRRGGSAALRALHEEWRRWTSNSPSFSSESSSPARYLSCEMETEQLLAAALHRHRSVYLPLPRSWLAAFRESLSGSADLPAQTECFAQLISALAADGRVARLVGRTAPAAWRPLSHFTMSVCLSVSVCVFLSQELSRPVRALNKNARSITQSGALGVEPFSDAGLDGLGQVRASSSSSFSLCVTLTHPMVCPVRSWGCPTPASTSTAATSATRSTDRSGCTPRLSVCLSAWIPLLSPFPQVPRSDVDHLIVETKYRKVIEYVNFSGSAGDYKSGYLSQWLWPWQPNLILL